MTNFQVLTSSNVNLTNFIRSNLRLRYNQFEFVITQHNEMYTTKARWFENNSEANNIRKDEIIKLMQSFASGLIIGYLAEK